MKFNKLLYVVTRIYSKISTIFERIFLKRNTLNFSVKENYEVIKLENFKLKDCQTQILKSNKYLEKIIYKKDDLLELIRHVFIDNSLANIITNKTGYCYSIDFFTAYTTSHISEDDQKKGWYANHWHTDKPFSNDMLKVIIPLESIDENKGAMEIVSKNNDTFKATLQMEEVFIFYPNRCLHRAGNPNKNFIRKQMMFQLNPSKSWKVNREIFKRQSEVEPKFPHFKYFFDTKILLNNI